MQVYPVDDFYNYAVEKKLNGEKLNEYEQEKIAKFEVLVEKKAINDAAIIKNLSAEREAISNAISDLEKKLISLDSKIEKIQYDLKTMLEINDIKKIKTPFYDIIIALNNPSTNIYDESLIPMDYVKQTVVQKIDKIRILKDLKEGILIPGVDIQQRTRLDIK